MQAQTIAPHIGSDIGLEALIPGMAARAGRMPKSPSAPRQPKDAALLNAMTVIAHDMRGPLANLAIMIELIETYAKMQAHTRVTVATQKAQLLIDSLDAMLNGFLQRVRETGDPLSFKPALLDLADVVTSAVSLNQPLAESRDIKFDTTDARPLAIDGDSWLLIEAVSNLVGNAVKHAPAGSTVTVAVERKGTEAAVRVSDEGQGLTELDLRRAFRPFSTLSAQYQGKGASWGLGLWIVRLIAERHGGRAAVGATENGGASFAIHVPID